MSNTVYPEARDAIGTALVDLTVDDLRCVLVKSPGAYDAAHDFLDDLGANTVGTAVALAGRAIAAGILTSTTVTASFPAVAVGPTIVAVVYYIHTGVSSTSRLIAWVDTNSDGTAINVVANGGPIDFTVPSPLLRL